MSATDERLLRADELARRLGVSECTVRRWVRSKLIRRGVVQLPRPARTVRFIFSEVVLEMTEEQQRRTGRL